MKRSILGRAIPALLALAATATLASCAAQPEPASTSQPEPAPSPGRLVVRFLDVGQGDAQLVHTPEGKTILIDAGEKDADVASRLGRYGVKKLDLIIATHPHADHIGGMQQVIRAFEVGEFWDSGFPHTTRTYLDLLSEIRARKIRSSMPRRGALLDIGGVTLEVLHPGITFPGDEANNASLIVRLSFGERRFLFTGDAELPSDPGGESAWSQVLALDRALLRADVLKLAHHGSSDATSDLLLDAVDPSAVTISCAAGNDYHYPHPRVMGMLARRLGLIDVFRTDLHGTVTAVSDGKTLEFSVEKEVARDSLYLTGDEVAGKLATGDRKGGSRSGSRGARAR